MVSPMLVLMLKEEKNRTRLGWLVTSSEDTRGTKEIERESKRDREG